MAGDIKISAMTSATTPLTGTEVLPIVSGGVNYKTTVADLNLGYVSGPASSTDNAIVRFDGTTGKLVQNSSVTISDTGNIGGAVNISASGVIDVSDGTASLPSLTNTGDLNTGLWFPAADTIGISTGGTEQMRITSAGNVGVGTTTPSTKLDVVGTSSFSANMSLMGVGTLFNNSSALEIQANSSATNGLNIATTSATPVVFKTNGSEKMRIDSAGRVAISGPLNEAAYVTVASAATTDIGAALSNNVLISGTTTITSFGTANAGITRRCKATGAFLITYDGTSLITANAKNIVTKVDDCFTMTSLGSGNWKMTSFTPADGRILANNVNNQTGTTYTLAITDLGNDVTLSNASAITLTLPQTSNVAFPIGSKIKIMNLGVGVVTIVKEGSETLTGNTTLIQGADIFAEKISTSAWRLFGGTAVVNMPSLGTANLSITTSNTKRLWRIQANCTLLGITYIAFSVGTAGTFKLQLNGADITGLTSLVPATTEATSYVTTATNLVAGDVITIVADGTLVTVADLNISPIFTVTY